MYGAVCGFILDLLGGFMWIYNMQSQAVETNVGYLFFSKY